MDTAPINAYLEFTIEILNKWVSYAQNKIIPSLERITAAATSIFKYQLRSINISINRLKEDLKELFETYKEIEEEYELEPLSVEYYYASLENREKIKELVSKIQNVAEDYQFYIEKTGVKHPDFNVHIIPSNQNSIKFLQGLTEEDLLKLLEDGYLAGF